jgi:hypothetical protein
MTLSTSSSTSAEVVDLRAKMFEDLAPIAVFAEAIKRTPRSVHRMVQQGLPITYVGKTPYVIISKAREFLLGTRAEHHAAPRRGRPPGKKVA